MINNRNNRISVKAVPFIPSLLQVFLIDRPVYCSVRYCASTGFVRRIPTGSGFPALKSLRVNDDDLLDFIDTVGCIQYDPLNVTGRNPDLVVQSRCQRADLNTLSNLLYKRRMLYDGWDKNMSVISLKDWAFFESRRVMYENRHREHLAAYKHIKNLIHEKIREQGWCCSRDVVVGEKIRWPWGRADVGRTVLESMFNRGESLARLIRSKAVIRAEITGFYYPALGSAVMDWKKGRLTVLNWWDEEAGGIGSCSSSALIHCLEEFARFLGAGEIAGGPDLPEDHRKLIGRCAL